MHRTVRLTTLPTIVLFGLLACSSDDTGNRTTAASTTSVETEEAVAVESEPEETPTATSSTDYPEREVKPEDEWMSNYVSAEIMADTGMHLFDPYEFHPLVGWEPDEQAELAPTQGSGYDVCSINSAYWGIFYLDQPLEEFTNYASEETNLDNVAVQYDARDSHGGMDVIVNIPVTCESWGYIVDTYGINQNISPKQVLLSEEVAYSIVDIDALAEREIRDSHEANPLDIRDTERVHQIYYRFDVPSV